MSNRRILKRTYYDIHVTLISPVNISNGVSVETDADVVRNSLGEFFIPGTSLAGAFRNYIGDDKKAASVFGFSYGEKGSMSSVFISDLYFEKDTVKASVRDRVCLTDAKDVDNKFDMEIIEPGAKGVIAVETVQREGEADMDDLISDIIIAIEAGDIRFGANKNRGLGRVQVTFVGSTEFTEDSLSRWIDFMSGNADVKNQAVSFEAWSKDKRRLREKYYVRSIDLELTGGISIRRYSAQPGKADFEHITSNGRPVIPGTSWTGAIRADARRILKDMKADPQTIDTLIDDWFGKVKEKKSGDNNDSRQSRIVIAESVIKGSKMLPMTRNNINRFTAGTKDGALYTELACIGGTTKLEYLIRKDEKLAPLRGMMKLIEHDICLGMVAVGGQVSVGRGIFSGEPADLSDDEDLKALYEEIRGHNNEDK